MAQVAYRCEMPSVLAKQLPYLLHTNRELGLMRAKKKPLSHFADGEGCFPQPVQRYLRHFDRHVETGEIIRRDVFCPPNANRAYTLHRILFALPGEEWRIDEMIKLTESLDWGPNHERREGELLGYEDWMIDHFLSLLDAKRSGS
jgi:hypothetical protein